MPEILLEGEAVLRVLWNSVAQVVLVKEASKGLDGGYLNVSKGQECEVLYVGDSKEKQGMLSRLCGCRWWFSR